ncbi:MAG: glucosaminidase domain-containing protein [Bacteroidales bacterium]|nr:glucosaminidase domain-containing protein [Bacteroidales bacterium]
MKILITLIAGLFMMAPGSAQPDGQTEAYIRKYAPLAVSEMYRSGVPASITLAQGILESGSGASRLAVQGNNHFGIKCHNTWEGAKIYHDDDAKNECFRAYDDPEQSFRDHSDFLRYRDRYKFLFDFPVSDYKAWAYGLKTAGYATDPAYPSKLIRYIEEYKLDRYDSMKPEDFGKEEAIAVDENAESKDRVVAQAVQEERTPAVEPQKELSRSEMRKVEREAAKKAKLARDSEKWREKALAKKGGTAKGAASVSHPERADKNAGEEAVLPDSPNMVETPHLAGQSVKESFMFSLSRPIYELNNAPFILSEEGDSYASIAEDNGIFLSEVLRFNDLKASRPLPEGSRVYLKPKQNAAAPMMDKYVAEGGETLWDLSQRFAVRLSTLEKLNHLKGDSVLRDGDVVLLRKPSKK